MILTVQHGLDGFSPNAEVAGLLGAEWELAKDAHDGTTFPNVDALILEKVMARPAFTVDSAETQAGLDHLQNVSVVSTKANSKNDFRVFAYAETEMALSVRESGKPMPESGVQFWHRNLGAMGSLGAGLGAVASPAPNVRDIERGCLLAPRTDHWIGGPSKVRSFVAAVTGAIPRIRAEMFRDG